MIIYAADGMSEEGRTFTETFFGIPVIFICSAVECFKIGFLCEERKEFHVHEDLCPVKIVDMEGRDVTDGEQGEVVISNLVNRATVLMNYRLGDVASLAREKCPYGRSLPLLTSLEGRIEDILPLPGGRFLHPWVVW